MVETLKDAIIKYHKILSKTGFRSYGAVDYLIILSFLQELTDEKYGIYLQYEDIRDIIELLRLINDRICEYCEKHDIDYRDYLEGHWLWDNDDLWLNQQLYIGDKTVCERCKI